MKTQPIRQLLASFAVLPLLSSASAAILYWDTNSTTAGSGNAGGTWDTAVNNWNTVADGTGPLAAFVNGDSVVFSAGTDGVGAWTVTVNGTVATPSITIEESGAKTFSGGIISMGTGGLTINTDLMSDAGGNSAIFNSAIAGAGGLTVVGHGDLSGTGGGSNSSVQLLGVNTFSGDVTVTAGLAGFNHTSAFGAAANDIFLNGGGIQYQGGGSAYLNRDISVSGSALNTIRVYGGLALRFTGNLGNDGATPAGAALQKTDGGTLWLAGTNSFKGDFNIRSGDVVLANDNPWADTNFRLTDTAGRLLYQRGGTMTIGSLVTQRDVVVDNRGTLNIASGSLGFDDANFWMQTSTAGDTGYLTSSSGTLTVTAPYSYNSYGDQAIRLIIKDPQGGPALSLVKEGIGALVLDKSNTYSGGTTINGGRINADRRDAFGSGTVTVNSGGQALLSLGGGSYANNFAIAGIGSAETAGNLGALRFANHSTVSGNVTLTGDARLTAYGAGDNGTIGGTISGAFNLEKTGAGTLNLNGSGTGLTGLTTVNGGTLNVNGGLGGGAAVTGGTLNLTSAVAGAVTVADAQTFGALGGAVGGSLTLGATAATGTSNLRVHGTGTPTAVAGDLVVNGVSTVTLVNKPAPGTGAINLLTYGGSFVDGNAGTVADSFVLAGAANYRAATFAQGTGAITLDLGERKNLTWAPGANGNWNVAADPNWFDGAAASTFYWADTVLFDDSATNKTVTLTANVEPAAITVNNSAGNDYTITGTSGIGGGTGIAKNGAGTLTLGGANTFTGAVAVNAGLVKLGSATGLGNASAVTVAAGAALDFNNQTPGTSTRGYSFTVAGSGTDGSGVLLNNAGAGVASNAGIRSLTLSGDATIGGTQRYDIGLANNVGYGTVNGNGFTLTKTGTAPVAMRGPATNISIVVNQGTLWAENDDWALGSTGVTVNAGANLGTYGGRIIPTPVTLNAGANLVNQGGGTGTWTGAFTQNGDATYNTANNSIIITGAINAAAGAKLTKINGNTLVLTGTNNFSGVVEVQAGTLQVGNTGSGGTLGSPTQIDVGTAAGAATLLYRLGTDTTLGSTVNFVNAGSLLQQNAYLGSNKLILTGTVGNNIANGTIRATRGEIVFASGSNITANQLGMQGEPAGDRATITVQNGATVNASYLNIGHDGGNSGIFNQTGGTVTLASGGLGVRIGHWNGNRGDVGSEMNLSGGTFDASLSQINVGWDGLGTLNVSGSALVKAGVIRLDANGDSTAYASGMNVSGGTVEVGSGGIAGASPNDKIVLTGGTLMGVANSTWSGVIDTVAATAGNIGANPGVVVTQSAVLNGSGTVNKTGTGALVLSGTSNAYAGITNVNAGSLRVTGALGGTTNVNAGGTLSGTGSIVGDVNISGTLAPGATELLGVGGTIYLGAAGKTAAIGSSALLLFDLDGQNSGSFADDLVAVTGDLTFASGSKLVPQFFGASIDAGTYDLFSYTGTLTGAPTVDATALTQYRGSNATLDTTEAGYVKLNVTAATAGTVYWSNGSSDGLWNVNGSQNWLSGAPPTTPDKFYQLDTVFFDDFSPAGTVTLSGTINPASVTVDSDNSFTFAGSGQIAGTTALTKDGLGTLVLATDNTFGGGVTIFNGVLQVGNGGASGSFGSGAVSNNGSLVFDRSGELSIANSITGGGSLTKNGGGNVILVGDKGYTGGTTVNAGTLTLSGTNNGLSSVGTGTLTINAGGLVVATSHNPFGHTTPDNIPHIVINGGQLTPAQYAHVETIDMIGGTINLGTSTGGDGLFFNHGTKTLHVIGSPDTATIASKVTSVGNLNIDVDDGAQATDLLMSGPIVGGGVTKLGAGTMVISGTPSFTGSLAVNAGTVALQLPAAATVNNAITGTGTLRNDGTAMVTLAGDNTGFTGTIDTNGQDLHLTSSAAGGASGTTIRLEGDTLSFQPSFAEVTGQLFRASFANLDFTTPAVTDTTTADFQQMHNTTGTVVPANTTYAYVGEIYLTAGTTYYFAEGFDDAVLLKIGGTTLINDTVWNNPVAGNYTPATTGWYSLDLRIQQGGGGVGPYGANGWTAGKGIGVTTTAPTAGAGAVDGVNYLPLTVANLGLLGVQVRAIRYPVTVAANVISAGGAANTLSISSGSATIAGVVSGSDPLVKAGAGTVTLAGANTHSGDTTVNAGTLGISSAYLSDTSTVTIAAGAMMNLNFAGNDVVGALVLGGTPMGSGVYNATTHPAYFSGGGSLQVGAASDYDTWAGSYSLAGADALPGADPDRDGVPNSEEYAFGLSPVNPASVSAIKGGSAASGTFTYTRRNPALTGLSYSVLTSTTLVVNPNSWAPDAGAVQTVIGTAGDVQTVQVALSPDKLTGPKLFFRVAAN